MMSLLSRIKTWGIQAADFYTEQNEPYEQITRPFLPATLRSLAARETECFDDLSEFWRYNELLLHRVPLPQPQPLDTGDQAIWQGIYAAMLAFKYAVTKSEAVAVMLAHTLEGMRLHQLFHKEGRPRLIRGYEKPDRWQDDASNDSLTGHFAGLYFAYRHGPDSVKPRCFELLQGITASLIANDLQLTNADGTPTKHGKLIAGVATDPLQMTLVLAILTVAEVLDLHPYAAQKRHEIWTKYGSMTAYPKVSFGAWTNWNDDHRGALHLAILAREDASPRMQDRVRWGFERLWKLGKKRGNIWVNALIAYGLGNDTSAELYDAWRKQALMILGEFELDKKRYDLEVVNEGKVIVAANGNTWQPKVLKYGKQLVATQPLPLWCMSGQDFFWQRHRYSVNDRIGQTQPSSRLNGCDFLAAYWLSRYMNILKSQD